MTESKTYGPTGRRRMFRCDTRQVFKSADGQPLYQLLGIISLYRKKKSGPKLLFHGPKWLSKDVTLGGGFIF